MSNYDKVKERTRLQEEEFPNITFLCDGLALVVVDKMDIGNKILEWGRQIALKAQTRVLLDPLIHVEADMTTKRGAKIMKFVEPKVKE